MHNGFLDKCSTCLNKQNTIYSAGTMLSFCGVGRVGGGKMQSGDEEELFVRVVMQDGGWRDVSSPQGKPEGKDGRC